MELVWYRFMNYLSFLSSRTNINLYVEHSVEIKLIMISFQEPGTVVVMNERLVDSP